MRILYLIGNGFDLNAGLKTGARDFVRTLFKSLEEREAGAKNKGELLSEGQRAMLESMRKDIDTWADFEIALGQFTSALEGLQDPVAAFMDAYDYLFDLFGTVITEEDSRAQSIEITDETAKRFANGATSLLEDVLSEKDRKTIDSVLKIESWEIDFVTFNYTCLLNRLVEAAKQQNASTRNAKVAQFIQPAHVHGQLGDGWGILIGVDNQEQIAGATCRESEPIRNRLIKPVSNERAGMLRDAQTSGRIRSAEVIAVYGMSLGESDAKWWHELAEWLGNRNAPNRRLIIAMRQPTLHPLRSWERPDYQESIKTLFLDRAGIEDEDVRSYLSERMVIPLGSSAFNLFVIPSDNSIEGLSEKD